jgi:hypothetical protein
MNEAKLGQLIDSTAGRDAIHVAIAPVEAGEGLRPGERVGVAVIGDRFIASRNAEPKLGIIDPFLTETVPAGKRCYICLFPGTITGLRHVWMHPAFQRSIQ